jgi:hypothetical protein
MAARLLAVVCLVLLAGCSSLTVTRVRPQSGAPADGGVRYVLTKPVWTMRVKEARDGSFQFGDKNANVRAVYEIDTVPSHAPDYEHVYEVKSSRGLLTSDSLTLKLGEGGSLNNVAATSEPQLTEIIRFAGSLAAAAVTFARGEKPADGPDIKALQAADAEVQRFTALEKHIRVATQAAASQLSTNPLKVQIEALKLLEDQLAQVRTALRARKEKVEAEALGLGDTVSQVIPLTTFYCDVDKWPTWSDVDKVFKRLQGDDGYKSNSRWRAVVFARPVDATARQAKVVAPPKHAVPLSCLEQFEKAFPSSNSK